MEGTVTLAIEACADRFRKLSVVCALSENDEGSCYLLRDCNGKDYLLKLASGTRRSMLSGEWDALTTLARLAPQCAPAPIMRGEDTDFVWLLREYIQGQTLFEWVEARGRVPACEAMNAANDLIKLIKQIHLSGLICRDIKPENLVRTPEGRWALIDAGTVRKPAPDKDGDTALYVTKGFAAPEQYGFAQSDARTDVYALGVTLCCLFTGSMDASALSSKKVPRRARKVISRCMAFSPEARYADMDEVYRALNNRCLRHAVIITMSALALCAVAICLYLALSPKIPTADSFESLADIIYSAPEGANTTIRLRGDIRSTSTIYLKDGSFTFIGDGVVTGENPDRTIFNVGMNGELTLNDDVLIQSALNPSCIAVNGGRLIVNGASVIKTAAADSPKTFSSPIYMFDNSYLEIIDGSVIDRRDNDSSICVHIEDNCHVVMSGGRIDSMGEGAQAVLLGRDSVFEMSGGMINCVYRTESGYTMNTTLGKIIYTGGDLLVNGLSSVPLEFSYTSVATYDELVQAIASRAAAGRIVVEGEIVFPTYIRVENARDIYIMGADKNSRITGGDGGLFLVSDDCSVSLSGLTVDGNAHIENMGGSVSVQDVELTSSFDFVTNHGGDVKLRWFTAHMEYGCLLRNGTGGTAEIIVTAVIDSGSAVVNEGDLLIRDSVIGLNDPSAPWVLNQEGASFVTDNVAFKRNGSTVEE